MCPPDPECEDPLLRSPFLAEAEAACDCYTVSDDGINSGRDVAIEEAIGPVVFALPAPSLRHAAPAVAPAPAVPDVLSFSHLYTYQFCRYRFYLQYLLHLPGRPNRSAGLVAAIWRGDWAPTPAAGFCGACPHRDGCPVGV